MSEKIPAKVRQDVPGRLDIALLDYKKLIVENPKALSGAYIITKDPTQRGKWDLTINEINPNAKIHYDKWKNYTQARLMDLKKQDLKGEDVEIRVKRGFYDWVNEVDI